MAVSKKLTPWFPGDVKPARNGPYLTRLPEIEVEAYRSFRGGAWHIAGVTPEHADNRHVVSATQNWHWRGLAEQPKETK